jgi:hypothetical protein
MTPAESASNVQGTLAKVRPGLAFVVMIFGALVAFEIFNYSTTEHALQDLLGNLSFAGLPWATVLAVAFCGIDFAGIARLFTPEQGSSESKEVWYLFGAWLLAATMNAILTWWGVSIAVVGQAASANTVVDPDTLTGIVPVFVAIMVWVIRILIIGTLSLAMDRLLHASGQQRGFQSAASGRPITMGAQQGRSSGIPGGLNNTGFNSTRPAAARQASSARGAAAEDDPYESGASSAHPEPTYHSMSGRPVATRNASGTNTGDRFRRS